MLDLKKKMCSVIIRCQWFSYGRVWIRVGGWLLQHGAVRDRRRGEIPHFKSQKDTPYTTLENFNSNIKKKTKQF